MINLEVSKIEDIPQDAFDALMKDAEKYECTFEDIDDLQEYIKEGGDYNEEIDSSHVNNNYFMEVNGFLFECYGSQYRKDQLICDEDMDGSVYITDVVKQKEAEKKAKADKANKAKTEAFKKWDNFFDEINSDLGLDTETTEKLKSIMSGYKFPTKLK
jgi:hypothetical protein